MNSDLTNMAIKTTYASDYDSSEEYMNEIINKLTKEFEGTSFYEELYNYIKDVYGEYFLELYLMGQDDTFEEDGEYLMP
jgi:hypothetical protein